MNTLQKYMLLLFFAIPIFMWGQTTVSGVVTESATGAPIPGVNVVIKGTTTGTSTDFDGNYQITAKKGDVLEFSYVGFLTQEITMGTSSTINVAMAEDAQQLEEVIVVGYGTEKKVEATGSINQISTESFNKGPITTADQLISGKIAGVSVTSGGGAPGEGQNIVIRGLGSLSLSSSPLIVLDGVPLDISNASGSRNILDIVNPNDIETFTVLKDASATSIYGARAANGVIMITTKKGKGREFTFNYNGYTTLYTPYKYVDVMTSDEFRSYINSTGDANAISKLGTSNTDWQKEIYQNAIGYEHAISAMGNVKGVMPVRASLGYSNHDGILKTDNFNRITGALNLRPYLFDDHLKIELNGRAMYTENRFANRGAISAAIDFDPTQSVYGGPDDVANYWGWYTTGSQGQTLLNNLAPNNPVAQLNLVKNTSEVRRFVGNAKVDYKLHFFEDLTATVNVGLDRSNGTGRTLTSELLPSASDDWVGSYYSYKSNNTNKLFDAYLTYDKSIGKSNVNVVAGHSYQKFDYESYTYDSTLEQEGTNPNTDGFSSSVLYSYFGRASYSYNDKYVLKATMRADASSKLNPDDRWGYFPSVSAAWNISNENFLKNSKVINSLKLRVGYGEIGNVNGLGDYLFLTRYTRSMETAYYQFGNTFYQTYRPEAYNENLKWEVGNTLDAGIDFSLFNDRVSGAVNAYLKKTNNLISFVTVDPFTNFSNQVNKNIGDMENKGMEVELNLIPVKTKDFNWKIGYNFSLNRNKITYLPDQVDTGYISGGTGNTVQLFKQGYAPFTYWVYKQLYDDNGKPIEGAFADRNGDNVINDEDRYMYKDPYADILMGINTTLSYKNFDLNVVTRASIGNYVYNNVASSKSYSIRATANNILTNLYSDYYNTEFTNLSDEMLASDYYVQNASFFKIDNITLGYNIKELIEGVKLRLYGSVQNVAIFTKYQGLDPEINGGIDNNIYPRPRSYVFGVNVDF